MRIINLKEFRAMPENTVFAKYKPCSFGDLRIKGETWEHDFLCQEIVSAIECSGSDEFASKLDNALEHGASIKMDFDCQGRDGLFDDDQLFAVWENEDVERLIERLSMCITCQSNEKEKG